jgi:hypothetical protein
MPKTTTAGSSWITPLEPSRPRTSGLGPEKKVCSADSGSLMLSLVAPTDLPGTWFSGAVATRLLRTTLGLFAACPNGRYHRASQSPPALPGSPGALKRSSGGYPAGPWRLAPACHLRISSVGRIARQGHRCWVVDPDPGPHGYFSLGQTGGIAVELQEEPG